MNFDDAYFMRGSEQKKLFINIVQKYYKASGPIR